MEISNNILTVTPEKAKKLLSENGLQVSDQQAAAIVKFLTTLATATITDEKLLPVYKSKH